MDDRRYKSGHPPFLDYASALLDGFDIQDDESREFLASLVAAGQVPEAEIKELTDLAIIRGKEEWDMLFGCAESVRNRTLGDVRQDPGLEPYLACVLSGQLPRHQSSNVGPGGVTKKPRKRGAPKRSTSHFWEDEHTAKEGQPHGEEGLDTKPDLSTTVTAGRPLKPNAEHPVTSAVLSPVVDPSLLLEAVPDISTNIEETASPSPTPLLAHHHSPSLKRTHTFKSSPFFVPSPTKKNPRPPRGTISSLPFPPLSASRFGLIQESLSHDPFALLVAVTFLIRTTGKAAIPVFHEVMEKFPSPEAFVAADLGRELVPMIAHLGLPAVRCAAIGRYARGWVERPPVKGTRFVVRGYPRLGAGGEGVVEQRREEEDAVTGKTEEFGLQHNDHSPDGAEPPSFETPKQQKRTRTKLNSSEWEIGHLTQGRYAIDSWRIFCRDMFLGKSENWMGQPTLGGQSEGCPPFEPEWKRVLPEDKELRACLRWMWMREGFEWDPATGDRCPLREEMRLAVDQGRVKYDEKGELVIVDGAED